MPNGIKTLKQEQAKNIESRCSNTNCCTPPIPIARTEPKVGRNDPCPCGNGRKFKKCCGQCL
ncbi:MAG: SEC-C domain-containing protein [Gammaproteobacteria bacterium]|nr:SEC-C domain-containing protein [Gammaproteobacteria bacterium]MBQ0839371.1 SEC-C domain-containing protein [Gammaproteobacteria bacterium]